MSEQVPSKDWATYERFGSIEARPYADGDQADLYISFGLADLNRTSLDGGMIARNPANANDQWYIAPDYFSKHYRAAHEPKAPAPASKEQFAELLVSLESAAGEYANYMSAHRADRLCKAREAVMQAYSASEPPADLRALIADDAWAATYQTMAQYRTALLAAAPPPATEQHVIELTPAEIQSGHDRVKWAEGLIRQLPETHEGRNSWLLNYASSRPTKEPVR